jgi:hypothetical protein
VREESNAVIFEDCKVIGGEEVDIGDTNTCNCGETHSCLPGYSHFDTMLAKGSNIVTVGVTGPVNGSKFSRVTVVAEDGTKKTELVHMGTFINKNARKDWIDQGMERKERSKGKADIERKDEKIERSDDENNDEWGHIA